TGNSEVLLDRQIADKRIYPAIDLNRSSTRKEELLLSDIELNRMYLLRNFLSDMPPAEAVQFLIERLSRTSNNEEFLDSMTAGE
ncbi:MAG: transcription termination factor Rho, partial [Gemmatimonadota bacterium]